MKQLLTLSIVQSDNRILLAMKKRGMGANRWNGYGGKVESGESIEEAARREALEEGKINFGEMDNRGLIIFKFRNDPITYEVHLFSVTEYNGEPRETEEMRPQWFDINSIPYDDMWPADRYWLPIFLEGKKIQGKVFFKDSNNIIDYNFKETE